MGAEQYICQLPATCIGRLPSCALVIAKVSPLAAVR